MFSGFTAQALFVRIQNRAKGFRTNDQTITSTRHWEVATGRGYQFKGDYHQGHVISLLPYRYFMPDFLSSDALPWTIEQLASICSSCEHLSYQVGTDKQLLRK